MKKFKGYQKGTKDGVITYKVWIVELDRAGFESTKVKYLNEEVFKALPKVGEEIR